MAASAAACALASAPVAAGPESGRFIFELADRGDDGDVRRLLREATMPGSIGVSLEREPNAAAAAGIEGDVHQTLVARHADTGRIVGTASRSVRSAFVNGRPIRLGYLGQLRFDRQFLAGRLRRHLRELLEEGFAFCRDLHGQGDTRLYLTSLVADNEAARRLLVERQFANAPRFSPVGRLSTFAISLSRGLRARQVNGVRICPGSSDLISEIADCLQRNLRRYQYAPVWTASDLQSPVRARDLRPEDFSVAIQHGRVIGCIALWDQRAFKQVVVRGYSPALQRWRRVANLASSCLGTTRLPAVGQPFRLAYLSHAAVDMDRGDVLTALMTSACQKARARRLEFVAIGFDDRHPFCQLVARQFPHRIYRSVPHVACWTDGEPDARAITNALIQPEVAVL
jgi:hypothetical protein